MGDLFEFSTDTTGIYLEQIFEMILPIRLWFSFALFTSRFSNIEILKYQAKVILWNTIVQSSSKIVLKCQEVIRNVFCGTWNSYNVLNRAENEGSLEPKWGNGPKTKSTERAQRLTTRKLEFLWRSSMKSAAFLFLIVQCAGQCSDKNITFHFCY